MNSRGLLPVGQAAWDRVRRLGLKPPEYLQLPRRPKVKPTPDRDAVVARMSRLAFANLINPEPDRFRPPNNIGYGRTPRWPKPDRGRGGGSGLHAKKSRSSASR